MRDILKLIEEKRAEMYKAMDTYGFNDDKTIKVSQELEWLWSRGEGWGLEGRGRDGCSLIIE